MAHNNLNYETDSEIGFFTPQFHPFDNFSAHAVEVWGKRFSTAEHAFQWKKYAATQPELLTAKAEQHEDVQELLKKSGNRTIIENSPFDSFWGSGPEGNGQNMVGKIWMEIRSKTR